MEEQRDTANIENTTVLAAPSLATATTPVKSKRFWLVEIWLENREVFKTLVEHPLKFSVPILSLLAFDFIFKHSAMGETEKEVLQRIDFYGIVAALGVFTIDYIIKLVLLALRRGK